MRAVSVPAACFVHQPPALDDEQPVRHLHRETEHLLRHHNRDFTHLANFVERLGNVLDDRRLDAFRGFIQQQYLGVWSPVRGQWPAAAAARLTGCPLASAHVKQHREQAVDFVRNLLVARILQPGRMFSST